MTATPTNIEPLLHVLIKGRVARRLEDLDEETLNALAASEVPAQYDYLDEIDVFE